MAVFFSFPKSLTWKHRLTDYSLPSDLDVSLISQSLTKEVYCSTISSEWPLGLVMVLPRLYLHLINKHQQITNIISCWQTLPSASSQGFPFTNLATYSAAILTALTKHCALHYRILLLFDYSTYILKSIYTYNIGTEAEHNHLNDTGEISQKWKIH